MELIEESQHVSKNKLFRWSVFLLIFSFIVCVGNYVGYKHPMNEAFIGMIILSVITIVGMVLERELPFNISSIVYISLIGLALALPFSPASSTVVYYVSQIELSSICTVFLAYVGIAIGKDWNKFKKIGWRGIVITIFVIAGTYLGSAFIAQMVLMMTGSI
ncbi:LysO family transporter [Methanobrevibacter olleyae]|uniref:DUF340 domain-containing protein n=1 Tax=Methanobrevibacter olleyae TaxID=294671 RepID=A0A126QXY1_METOL|nr:LysO family transporter [Methanobrevibacter olleyae]AMK14891.1 hypothetical protein YLM1_0331 [Methanobrevibacter olleyae]SFL44370.1 Membrane protein of unknown function [Methanobrevibacter olleyae]